MSSYRLIHVLLLLFVIAVSPIQAEEIEQYKPLPGYSFVYISSDLEAQIPEISDSLFNADAKGIRFDVNKTQLRTNEPFIDIYKSEIAPLLREKGLVLRKLIIKGAASPEGPYDNNRRLGLGRTQRLVEFINSQFDNAPDVSLLQSNFVCEDYEYLTVLMAEANDPEAAAVKKIWDDSNGDEPYCKRELQKLNGGKTWKRLLNEYFPQLRQARVMMFFGTPLLATLHEGDLAQKPNKQTVSTVALPPEVPTLPYPPLEVKTSRLPLIALRTNLVHDLFYMPNFGFAPSGNVQLEFFPLHGHLTYNAGFSFSNHRHWSECKFFQIRDLQLELRRYFREGHPYRGAFLGVYAHGFCYGIGFNEKKGWEGEGLGAGLSGGYTLKLNRKGSFRLEFTAALGVLATRHDPYVYGNPVTGEKDGKYYYDYTGSASKFKKRNHMFTWFGPTNLGIQLTYDIVYRKKGGKK